MPRLDHETNRALDYEGNDKLQSGLNRIFWLCAARASEHLVESRPTGDTFLVEQFEKTTVVEGVHAQTKTVFLMVYKIVR